jgi:hypothetical protein
MKTERHTRLRQLLPREALRLPPPCQTPSRRFLQGLAILFVSLAVLILTALHTEKALAQGEKPPDHGRGNCHMCHSDPNLVGELGDGEVVGLFVDPAVYYTSVHGLAGLECLACHADQDIDWAGANAEGVHSLGK